ncbi:MAG: aminotransferase class V-fold PLP-dependent enzyme [Gemmatimonadaceae bacterium]
MSRGLEQWRADTPGVVHRNHLNNAGAGLMTSAVVDAMVQHLRLEAEIGGYEAADARAAAVAGTYGAIADLIGAASRNVAIVASATQGFVQSLSSFDLRPGDVIVTSRSDYTSYQIQFISLAQRLGVRVVHAPDLPGGGVDPQALREILRSTPCRLVHISWVPTHSGLVQDVEAVGAVCEEAGVPFLVDACQAAGQIPIDVARLRCDYLSVTARKFLRGPRGIGFLYVSDPALARGDHPLFVDMRGATWEAPGRYRLEDTARRHEDWEFPYALVAGLGAAARYATAVGVATGGARAFRLAADLRRRLDAIDGVRTLDPGTDPCAIVTAAVDGWLASDLVTALRDRRINTSATLRWYGLLDLTARGVDSAVRLSPHYYNTDEEIDEAANAIAELVASRKTNPA